jgi:hypothetical protein
MNRASSYLESDTVKVEHVFTFKMDDKLSQKWDQTIRKVAESFLSVSWKWAESGEIIAYGLAAFLVMLGASKLIDSVNSAKRSNNGSKDGAQSKDGGSKAQKDGKVKVKRSKEVAKEIVDVVEQAPTI